jgi:hypothetical protein
MKAERESRDKAPSSPNLDIRMKLVVSFTQTTGIRCKEALRAPELVWTFEEEKNLLSLPGIKLLIVQHKA